MIATDLIETLTKRYDCKGPVGCMRGRFNGKSVSDQSRTITGIATTDRVDLEREVMVPTGADLGPLLENRAVFIDHKLTTPMCVGRIRTFNPFPGVKNQRGWSAVIDIAEAAGNNLCDHVLALARNGGVGMSIGYEVIDGGRVTPDEARQYPGAKTIVRRWKAIELSIAAAPMNIDCQGYIEADQTKGARARELLTKSRAPDDVFKALGLFTRPMALTMPMELTA